MGKYPTYTAAEENSPLQLKIFQLDRSNFTGSIYTAGGRISVHAILDFITSLQRFQRCTHHFFILAEPAF